MDSEKVCSIAKLVWEKVCNALIIFTETVSSIWYDNQTDALFIIEDFIRSKHLDYEKIDSRARENYYALRREHRSDLVESEDALVAQLERTSKWQNSIFQMFKKMGYTDEEIR